MIELSVDLKNPPMTWDDFNAKYKNSVALDGYVIGPAKFDRATLNANFNHHEQVDRLSTRATCAQALMAVRQGFIDNYRINNSVNMILRVNDCDQDVCLAVFILMNSWICDSIVNPNLNKLVHVADMMDTCGGCYPFPIDMPFMQSMAWIFEPYTMFRNNGGIERRSEEQHFSIITDVGNRIQQYIAGSGKTVELKTDYTVVGGGKNWSMVNEIGANARMAMTSNGVKAFVSVRKKPHTDNNWVYSVGKISEYVDFDINRILVALNKAEKVAGRLLPVDPNDEWGGSNLIGGSPRVGGSVLPPDKVANVINEVVDAH